jgi:predicted Rossmann fold flavoprotein
VFGSRGVHDSFIGIINKKIIPIILKEAKIEDIKKPCCNLDWKEKNAIYSLLKQWKFEVSGTNSFTNAQVTAGGINTKEVNPETLESNITPNLYFAGEVLDVDGDCGGFNLQWAWSSGAIAAKNASK